MRSQYQTHFEIFQVLLQIVFKAFGIRFFFDVSHGTNPIHIVDDGKGSIFNGIKQHHLSFYVLYEFEQEGDAVFFFAIGFVFIEKSVYNFSGCFSFFKTFNTSLVEQRQKGSRFADSVKR